MILQCSECLLQWKNMSDYQEKEFMDEEVIAIEPDFEEIQDQEWHKLIIQS